MSDELEDIKGEADRRNSSFSFKCRECQRVKHKQKFKRYNGFHHVCNECFLDKKGG
jgi:hypothetical protein